MPLGTVPSIFLLCKFAAGSFIMRSAGCTINDIFDRNIDIHKIVEFLCSDKRML